LRFAGIARWYRCRDGEDAGSAIVRQRRRAHAQHLGRGVGAGDAIAGKRQPSERRGELVAVGAGHEDEIVELARHRLGSRRLEAAQPALEAADALERLVNSSLRGLEQHPHPSGLGVGLANEEPLEPAPGRKNISALHENALRRRQPTSSAALKEELADADHWRMNGQRVLDQVIRTQTALAAPNFDLDAVLRDVVDEARALTGAESAVVEAPDGAVIASTAGRRRRRSAARSTIVVSLPDASHTGVLKVCSPGRRAFSAEDVRVLELLAGLVWSALTRATLPGRQTVSRRPPAF
jgi:hypothetical protein